MFPSCIPITPLSIFDKSRTSSIALEYSEFNNAWCQLRAPSIKIWRTPRSSVHAIEQLIGHFVRSSIHTGLRSGCASVFLLSTIISLFFAPNPEPTQGPLSSQRTNWRRNEWNSQHKLIQTNQSRRTEDQEKVLERLGGPETFHRIEVGGV